MNVFLSSIIILIQIPYLRSLEKGCISNTSWIFVDNFVSNLDENQTISVEKLKSAYDIDRYLNNSTNLSRCSRFSNKKKQKQCFLQHCISIEDILRLHSIPQDKALTVEDVYTISPDLLYQVITCNGVKHQEREEQKPRPPSEQAWGFGFLCVTIINMCSLAGAVVLPCTKKAFYKKILIYMVALAVGTLSTTGLLVLMPEALGLMYTDDFEISHYYIWKASTVLGGIYLFFLIEKFLKAFIHTKQLNEEDHHYSSIRLKTPVTTSKKYSVTKITDVNVDGAPRVESGSTIDNVETIATIDDNGVVNGQAKREETVEKKPVATVAWMIIFGDGLHNFIDGLTIGAAFTDSILAGVSISVSCFCEELPHELGLIAGTLLGENTTAHDWIFAIAGGMFLYISLVDIMPEMSNDSESDDNKKNIGGFQIFILQNLGMFTGYAVILIMALYGGEINFEK